MLSIGFERYLSLTCAMPPPRIWTSSIDSARFFSDSGLKNSRAASAPRESAPPRFSLSRRSMPRTASITLSSNSSTTSSGAPCSPVALPSLSIVFPYFARDLPTPVAAIFPPTDFTSGILPSVAPAKLPRAFVASLPPTFSTAGSTMPRATPFAMAAPVESRSAATYMFPSSSIS